MFTLFGFGIILVWLTLRLLFNDQVRFIVSLAIYGRKSTSIVRTISPTNTQLVYRLFNFFLFPREKPTLLFLGLILIWLIRLSSFILLSFLSIDLICLFIFNIILLVFSLLILIFKIFLLDLLFVRILLSNRFLIWLLIFARLFFLWFRSQRWYRFTLVLLWWAGILLSLISSCFVLITNSIFILIINIFWFLRFRNTLRWYPRWFILLSFILELFPKRSFPHWFWGLRLVVGHLVFWFISSLYLIGIRLTWHVSLILLFRLINCLILIMCLILLIFCYWII